MRNAFFAWVVGLAITAAAHAQLTPPTATTQTKDDKELRQEARDDKKDRKQKRHDVKAAKHDETAAKENKEIKADNKAVKQDEMALRKDGTKHPYRATIHHLPRHH